MGSSRTIGLARLHDRASGGKKRTSFLKKRSKKLLFIAHGNEPNRVNSGAP
jgi:hypothetical protein